MTTRSLLWTLGVLALPLTGLAAAPKVSRPVKIIEKKAPVRPKAEKNLLGFVAQSAPRENAAVSPKRQASGMQASSGFYRSRQNRSPMEASRVPSPGLGFREAFQNLRVLNFPAHKVGYAVGKMADSTAPERVYKTTDRGRTWTPLPALDGRDVAALDFIDRSIGYAVGANGLIARTADGGETWVFQPSGTSKSLMGVDFLDSLTGYAAGLEGTLLKTLDGGTTWLALFVDDAHDLNAVHFRDPALGYAVGDAGTILKTVDGGKTWNKQIVDSLGNAWAVFAAGPSTCLAAGNGRVFKTEDGGDSWKALPGAPVALSEVFFVTAESRAVTGYNASLFREGEGAALKKVAAFDASTVRMGLIENKGLWFVLPADAHVRIRLLDVAGREKALLVDGMRPGGRSQALWPRNQAAGIYAVDFRVDKFQKTIKAQITQ